MINSIGGYFELELHDSEHYHKNAIRLNTARNCLEYILRVKNYHKIYIPYYTCEVILEPIKKVNIEYEFYHIDKDLNPVFEKNILSDEAFLYTNYFGLKQKIVELVAKQYKNVIIDNSQAFFALPIKGTDTFYSARKFFGVPDGAYLYTDKYLNYELEQDVSYTRMSHLLKRIDISAEAGYNDFKTNDDALENQPILKMSKLTENLLKSIDYQKNGKQRIQNYKYLDNTLKTSNEFCFQLHNGDVPMVYPYMHEGILKEKLIANKIYVATYWANVYDWCKANDIEYYLVQNAIFLPIDQRYEEKEIIKIIKIIDR